MGEETGVEEAIGVGAEARRLKLQQLGAPVARADRVEARQRLGEASDPRRLALGGWLGEGIQRDRARGSRGRGFGGVAAAMRQTSSNLGLVYLNR